MKHSRPAFIISSIALLGMALGSCSLEEMQAQQSVREILKDPSSARFGQMTRLDSKHACLTVNAKNGFGGYGDDEEAWLAKVDGKWVAFNTSGGGKDFCIEYYPKFRQDMPAYPLKNQKS
jgi:hypothetical protein